MNITDYIIDTSNNEPEAMKKIADRAAAEHGNQAVDFIINNQQFSPDEAKEALIRLSQTKNPTKEDQPLIDVPGLRDISTPSNIYKGIENLGYGPAKLAAHLTTPVTEAVRSIPKYIAENVGENTSQTPPIDMGAEYNDPIGLPSSHAGAGLLMQDINNAFGIKNQPLAKVSSKDYPKAAQFLENLTVPANVAGMGADVAMAHAIPTPSLPKVPVISLEAAADYVRSITKDNSLLKDLEKSGKIYDVARLVQTEPEKYLHQFRPNMVYENIMGKINPPEGSRLLGTGELARMNNLQNDLIETIPQNKYSIPAEELQKSAIADLQSKGGLEAGQKISAQKFIENNIPVIQPDADKLNRIRSSQLAQGELANLNSEIPGNRLALENELQSRKAKLIQAVSEQPDLVNNPKFREELQWLSQLPVVEDGVSVYPKQRYITEGSIKNPASDFTSNLPGGENVPFTSIQEYDPTVSKTGGVVNQRLMDIAGGTQKEPRMIPNEAKSQAIGSAIEETQRINQEIRELSNNPVSLVNNKELISKIDRRNQLLAIIKENFDPTAPSAESYMDYIRSINEKPIGYASDVRRLGNKLMEPAIPGEVSTDIGAKNLAGRSMERAARKAQEQAMAYMPPGGESTYQAQNKKISDLLNLRNLTEGGLAGAGGRAPYVPGSAGGTTGWVGSAAKAWDRYVKPSSQELLSGLANQAITNGTPAMKYSSVAANVTSEISKKSQLNNFKIPMSTEGAAMNSDMVYEKVMNEMGSKAAEMVRNTRSPEELRSVLRFLNQQNPSVFEQSKYNNIDGYIDPAFKQKAINDIVGDKVSPAHINADKMQLLLHEGKIQP